MKKRSIFIALLLSAVMVFGVFALTSFAEDSTDPGHDWHYNAAKKYPGGISFSCQSKAEGHDCDYNDGWTAVEMKAYDAVCNSEEYFGGYELVFHPDEATLPDEFDFDDPQYSVAGEKEWSDKAPSEVGAYDVRMELLIDGEGTGLFVYSSFNIYEMNVGGLEEEMQYGTSIKPNVFFTNKNGTAVEFDVEDDEYYFEYKSLDKPFAKYSKKAPKSVGHYRARATYGNGAKATMDFEIVKYNVKELEVLGAFSLDASKFLSELRAYDFTNQTMKEIRNKLAAMGLGSVKLCEYQEDSNTLYPEDNKPLFLLVQFEGGKFVSPEYFGIPVFECTDAVSGKKIKSFIPGVTTLKKGTYKITFSIPETRNHAAASGSVNVVIGEVDVKVIRKPAARENLIFNDTYQKLVAPGEADGGQFLYALTKKEDPAPDDDEYSEDIPTAREATDFVVWWKLVPDPGYKVTGEQTGFVDVSIAAYEPEDDPKSEDIIVPALKNVRASAGRRSFTVKWNSLSTENLNKIDNIEIQYSKDKHFKKGVKTRSINKSKTSYKVKSLKKGAKYYVRVRTVKYGAKDKDGNDYLKYASDWKQVKVRVK